MPKKKYHNVIDKLTRKPVFTFKEMLLEGIPYNYAKRLAHLLVKKGKVRLIEKGKYATVDDPFLIAPFTVFPSYISMYSALYLNGLLQQAPFTIEIVTTRRKKRAEIIFNESRIKYYRIKRDYFFGYRYINYEGFEIPMAYSEKALIDIFLFKMHPIGTINVEQIDLERLNEYLKRINERKITNSLKRWLDAELKRA